MISSILQETAPDCHSNRQAGPDSPPTRALGIVLALAAILLASTPLANAQVAAKPARGNAAQESPPGGGLGRLFYTPERRQVLDQQRLSNRPADKQVESRQLSFDGLVQRSSGKQTVWVNGRPFTERDSGILGVSPRPGNPGRARITIPNEGGHELAVGSQINRETGETSSPLKGGRVQVLARP
jgi:hypothetical protein